MNLFHAALFSTVLLGNAVAAPETPLKYLVRCLGVKTEGGKVVRARSTMTWPAILGERPPVMEPSLHSFGMDATITLEWKTPRERMDFLARNAFTKETGGILSDIPEIGKLFKYNEAEPSYSRDVDLPRLGLVQISAHFGNDPKKVTLDLTIGQLTRYFIRPEGGKADQTGTGPPAARPESKSEGGDKPHPK